MEMLGPCDGNTGLLYTLVWFFLFFFFSYSENFRIVCLHVLSVVSSPCKMSNSKHATTCLGKVNVQLNTISHSLHCWKAVHHLEFQLQSNRDVKNGNGQLV